ncbi:MAG: flagellar motor switch protein FliM [Alphaproteobacteria bacterium]
MAESNEKDQEAPNDDQMAAEWAAMLDEEDGKDGAPAGQAGAPSAAGVVPDSSTRILNQDEIDNLLGFDVARDAGEKTGIQAILNSALVSYERLPMLEVIFDRLVRLMTTSLRNFTSDNVEVTLDSITSIRFGDYLNSIPLPAMIGVYKAQEWDNFGLMTIDSALIYSIVDVLLGGRRGTAPMRIEGRPYTTIERNLIERLLGVVLADISAAFEPLSPVHFIFERLETNPRFATVARPANAAILVRLRIDMEDRGGKIEVVLPYATLEPVRDLLLQMFMGEKFGRDAIWETHLAQEIWRTDVEIEVVLDQQLMPLGSLATLGIGDTLMLGVTPESSVLLRCGGVPLLVGSMGRVGPNVAIKVNAPIATDTE